MVVILHDEQIENDCNCPWQCENHPAEIIVRSEPDEDEDIFGKYYKNLAKELNEQQFDENWKLPSFIHFDEINKIITRNLEAEKEFHKQREYQKNLAILRRYGRGILGIKL